MREGEAVGQAAEAMMRNAVADKASREKTWDEMGIEEKVERLRRVLRQQANDLPHIAKTAGEALRLSGRHQHSHNGEVLKPVNEGWNDGGGLAGGPPGYRPFDPLA